MDVAREETFGPIVPIATILSEDEALAIIDSSPFGLLTAVFTGRSWPWPALRRGCACGWVSINESTNYWESHLPFGGRAGSQSGIGRVGGASR